MSMEYGLHNGISEEAYFALDAMNASTLKVMRSASPKHARWSYLHPREPSRAMTLGRAEDVMVLTPEAFDEQFIIAPPEFNERRSNASKAWWKQTEESGLTPIREKDHADVLAMRDALWADPLARKLLRAPGLTQAVAYWHDPQCDIEGKARIDKVSVVDDITFLLDLKTTSFIRPWDFSKQASNLDYGIQLAWYRRGLDILSPREREVAIIAVEKSAPYDVVVYRPTPDMMIQAEQEALECVAQWRACLMDDDWPGYGNGVYQPLRYPKWRSSGDDE